MAVNLTRVSASARQSTSLLRIDSRQISLVDIALVSSNTDVALQLNATGQLEVENVLIQSISCESLWQLTAHSANVSWMSMRIDNVTADLTSTMEVTDSTYWLWQNISVSNWNTHSGPTLAVNVSSKAQMAIEEMEWASIAHISPQWTIQAEDAGTQLALLNVSVLGDSAAWEILIQNGAEFQQNNVSFSESHYDVINATMSSSRLQAQNVQVNCRVARCDWSSTQLSPFNSSRETYQTPALSLTLLNSTGDWAQLQVWDVQMSVAVSPVSIILQNSQWNIRMLNLTHNGLDLSPTSTSGLVVGGGMAVYATNATLIGQEWIIHGNRGRVGGGLLYVMDLSHISIYKAYLSENSATSTALGGGGVALTASANSTFTLSHGDFSGNLADLGAGMSAFGYLTLNLTTVAWRNSMKMASSSTPGEAMYLWSVHLAEFTPTYTRDMVVLNASSWQLPEFGFYSVRAGLTLVDMTLKVPSALLFHVNGTFMLQNSSLEIVLAETSKRGQLWERSQTKQMLLYSTLSGYFSKITLRSQTTQCEPGTWEYKPTALEVGLLCKGDPSPSDEPDDPPPLPYESMPTTLIVVIVLASVMIVVIVAVIVIFFVKPVRDCLFPRYRQSVILDVEF